MGLDANQILQAVFDPTNKALKLQGGGTGTGTQLAVWSGSLAAASSRIQAAKARDDGVITFLPVPNAAPNDAAIEDSEVTLYLDQGTNSLKFRVRYSDGTLKTATLALV